MSGNRDTFPASNESTGGLRRGSSDARDSRRMYKSTSAVQLQDCTKIFVPSSARTKPSVFKSQVASRSSMTKKVSVLLATKNEMTALAEGKVISKQPLGPKSFSLIGRGLFEGEQDFLSKPMNIDEEIKMLEDGRLSVQGEDTPLHEPMQDTFSEKVGIWLEESEHNASDLTEIAGVDGPDRDEEQLTKDQSLTSYSCCMTNENKVNNPACENGDDKQPERKPLSNRIVMTSQPVTATHGDTHSTGRHFVMLYFKIGVGVLAVLLGCVTRVFLLLRPTLWELYEPPPT